MKNVPLPSFWQIKSKSVFCSKLPSEGVLERKVVKIAVLKQRLHRRNADGTYDTIYLENSTINTLVDFAQASTPGVTLDAYLKSIGLGLTSALISDTNITDFASRPSGFYRGQNVTGAPDGSSDYYHYIWLKDSDTYGKLLAFKYTKNIILTCRFNNDTWEDWVRIGYDNTVRLGANIYDILDDNKKKSNSSNIYCI